MLLHGGPALRRPGLFEASPHRGSAVNPPHHAATRHPSCPEPLNGVSGCGGEVCQGPGGRPGGHPEGARWFDDVLQAQIEARPVCETFPSAGPGRGREGRGAQRRPVGSQRCHQVCRFRIFGVAGYFLPRQGLRDAAFRVPVPQVRPPFRNARPVHLGVDAHLSRLRRHRPREARLGLRGRLGYDDRPLGRRAGPPRRRLRDRPRAGRLLRDRVGDNFISCTTEARVGGHPRHHAYPAGRRALRARREPTGVGPILAPPVGASLPGRGGESLAVDRFDQDTGRPGPTRTACPGDLDLVAEASFFMS